MRESAVRTAIEMQQRAQVRGNLTTTRADSLPKFYRANYNVEYSGNTVAAPPKTMNIPVPQINPTTQAVNAPPQRIHPPSRTRNAPPTKQPITPPPIPSLPTPKKPPKTMISGGNDTLFLLSMILLLQSENADGILIAMLVYILL